MRASLRAEQAERDLAAALDDTLGLREHLMGALQEKRHALARVEELEAGMSSYERRTVIAHQTGPSVRGVLMHDYRDCIVLVHARSLDEDADLAGEVVIPKTQGVWMQVIDPEVSK